MEGLKQKRLRDPKFLVWMRALPCVACLAQIESDPDHINRPMQGSKALKAPDNQCLPLCHEHHVERHNMPVAEFYEVNTGHTIDECVDMAERIYIAYKDGLKHDAVKWILFGWRK